MKLKVFLIVLLISSIAFTETPKAIFESNTYKEGVYDITNTPQVKATAMLTTPNTKHQTPNTIMILIIIDPNGNEVFYKKFNTVNEPVYLGTILDNDRISVIGNGEIAITIEK